MTEAIIIGGFIIGALSVAISAIIAYASNIHPRDASKLMHDGPLLLMYLVGTWIFIPLGYVWAIAYLLLAVLGNIWFMTTICPYCVNHGNTSGVSAFCAISGLIARKGDVRSFPKSFRRNVGAVIAGWLIPPVGCVVQLFQTYRDAIAFPYNLFMLSSFSAIAFYLTPKASEPGCKRCRMRGTCPWKKKQPPAGN